MMLIPDWDSGAVRWKNVGGPSVSVRARKRTDTSGSWLTLLSTGE